MQMQQTWQNGGSGNEDSGKLTEERLASGLGWFSIGLGLAEVLAPRKVAQMIGLPDEEKTSNILLLYGVRELASGVGILTQPRPAGWMWVRVAGDLLDLATLASAMNDDDTDRTKVATAAAAVVGVTALDLICAQQLSNGEDAEPGRRRAPEDSPTVNKTIAINKPVEEVYGFWHDFENLPSFMRHLESVRVTGDRRSHWIAKAVAGRTVEWDAEMTEDQPNERIAWRSLDGSDIHNSGEVRFERAPGGRGTVIRVELRYAPPGGKISSQLAKLLGSEPGQLIDNDLRAFKQIMETGEVVKSDASIHDKLMHPAHPPAR